MVWPIPERELEKGDSDMYDNRHTSFSLTPLQLQVKQEHSNRNGDLVFTHVQPVPPVPVSKKYLVIQRIIVRKLSQTRGQLLQRARRIIIKGGKKEWNKPARGDGEGPGKTEKPNKGERASVVENPPQKNNHYEE